MIKNDLSDLSETTLIWRWRNLHPLKVQVQVNSAKKKDSIHFEAINLWIPDLPKPLCFGNICARKHQTRSHTFIQYCLVCHSRLARQIRFSFRGPMHNAKTVPAVQVRWRIWHPAQVSRKVTNVKEISRTNDCLQFLSPTVPFNCNLLHTQLSYAVLDLSILGSKLSFSFCTKNSEEDSKCFVLTIESLLTFHCVFSVGLEKFRTLGWLCACCSSACCFCPTGLAMPSKLNQNEILWYKFRDNADNA